jgi:hypothetical protein
MSENLDFYLKYNLPIGELMETIRKSLILSNIPGAKKTLSSSDLKTILQNFNRFKIRPEILPLFLTSDTIEKAMFFGFTNRLACYQTI